MILKIPTPTAPTNSTAPFVKCPVGYPGASLDLYMNIPEYAFSFVSKTQMATDLSFGPTLQKPNSQE